MAYQPHFGITVSAAFEADVNSWLRRVCRVGRLLLLLPLQRFMLRTSLLFSFLHLPLISNAHDHLRLLPMSWCQFPPLSYRVCRYLCSRDTDGLLYVRVPVTSSPYNMYFGMQPLVIRWTWPSHRKRRWLSSVYMLTLEACSSTAVHWYWKH